MSKGKSVIKYIHIKTILLLPQTLLCTFWHFVNPAQNQQLISFGEIFVPLPGIQNKITVVTKPVSHLVTHQQQKTLTCNINKSLQL